MKGNKLLMVVNPVAGKLKISTAFFDVVRVFSDAGYEVTVRMTQGRGEATDIVCNFGGDYDLIVLCGGDGTLNEGVTGFIRKDLKIPIGYIPCGTTNDFAVSLGLERESMKVAAENIVNGRPYPIDVGVFGQNRYFNYIASFGAFTDTSYSAPQANKNALGHLAYIIEGLRTLPSIRPIYAKVTLDDYQMEDEFVFASVSNSTSIGGLVKLDSRQVDFSDGIFEVMLVKNPKTAMDVSKIIVAMQMGRYEDCCVSFHHTKKAVFEMKNDVAWALDGEYGGNGGNQVEISVLKRAVSIIL